MINIAKLDKNSIVKIENNDYYLIINVVKSNGSVKFFTAQKITTKNYHESEHTDYLTFDVKTLEVLDYNGDIIQGKNIVKIVELNHENTFRKTGSKDEYIFLNYSEEFKGVFKVVNQSNHIKNDWLK